MKKVVLSLVAACGLVGSGLAAVYNLKPGMAGHWNEDASWEEGTKPGAGDTVRIGEGVEATSGRCGLHVGDRDGHRLHSLRGHEVPAELAHGDDRQRGGSLLLDHQ